MINNQFTKREYTTAGEVESVPVSQMADTLQRAEDAFHQLEGLVSQVCGRLMPILEPEHVKTESKSAPMPPPSAVPLIAEIDSITERARRLTQILDSANARLVL